MLLAVNELWRFLVVSPHGPPSLPSCFWTADRIRHLLNHAALTSENNYYEPVGPPSLMRYMFWAVGASGMFKAKQGASLPPTHVRAKETALRGQERRFSFFPLFVFSSERFTARNHGGLNINLFSLRITDLARKYYIIDRCLSSNSQVTCCIHREMRWATLTMWVFQRAKEQILLVFVMPQLKYELYGYFWNEWIN